ncbi:imidazole glycerol phosphate synthase subunit HisH [Planctobacterium marinum]|uniref:imidazole glycerol phosphate synthase subunit HisH n=1 Tax=Planctobacterium marinum TaxID=1631968 RepID=UPI001E409D2B|nr:imidazole glycerol phosphate synthase subunit HisH [Planctobacterium marinum]MCC2606126.1 imidazole glycerol phosphate synthase subunit HisH [Planctobacterium marinum]
MSELIGIVSSGKAGNTFSIKQCIKYAGGECIDVTDAKTLDSVDKIVLPGVGAFHDAMEQLESLGLVAPLQQQIKQKPTLGICLGMQIMARVGFEHGKTAGLGIFDAEVKPMICEGKVPHMGFNKLKIVGDQKILKGVENETFYFMHSFELVNYTDIMSLSIHQEHQFVSSIAQNDVFGVQFHPEKSRDAGVQVFKNFINY